MYNRPSHSTCTTSLTTWEEAIITISLATAGQSIALQSIMMTLRRPTISILLLTLCIAICSSFQPAAKLQKHNAAKVVHLHQTKINNDEGDGSEQHLVDRRQIFRLATQGLLASSLLIGTPSASFAVVPTPTDLKRLQLGHSRVRYLLENWDRLTESCNNKAISSIESKQVVRTEGGGG